MFPPNTAPAIMQGALNKRNKDAKKGQLDIGTLVVGETVLLMWGDNWTTLRPSEAKKLGRKLLKQADAATVIPQFGVAKSE